MILETDTYSRFQWVMCQLKALEKCLRPSQLRRALESLPETLNDTYAQMLSRISEGNYETAVRIFHWLIFSRRPLHIEELAELAAVDFDGESPVVERFWEPDEILKICPGLITTVEEHNEIDGNEPRILVRLAHISVREYLLSHDIRRGQAARYQIEEVVAHTSIAECSLLYMRLFDMPPSDAEKEFPLAIYTAENWLYHYELAPEQAERVHELALDFFLRRKEAYSNWLSFYCSTSPPKFPSSLLDFVSDTPLNVAAAYGLVPLLKRMFTSSEIETSSVSVLKGALRFAYTGNIIPANDTKAVRLLLQHGADFSGDPRFSHMLHAASYFGFDDLVKMQLEEGFDVNTKGNSGTALQAAVSGRYDRRYYDVSAIQRMRPATGWQRPNEFLEHCVPTTLALLLEKGADPNLCDRQEWSPLLTSCYRGDIQSVKLLLDHGADPNFRLEHTDDGIFFEHSCLSAACYSGDMRIVKLLLDCGASIRSPGALPAAARASGKNIDMMRLFIEAGVDPNVPDEKCRETPLEIACMRSDPEAVELLLEYGANPHISRGKSGTLLHVAALWGGGVDVLKILIDRGLDLNAIGGDHGTALQTAAYMDDTESVKYFIERGADVHIQAGYFGSALRASLNFPNRGPAVLLLNHGADLNTTGPYGTTLRESLASIPKEKCEIFIKIQNDTNPRYIVVRKPADASFVDFDSLEMDEFDVQKGDQPPECVISVPPPMRYSVPVWFSKSS
jgi:ankyrin repeat protein